MKLNEFMWLEEKCPKCQSKLMLQKTVWSDMSGDLHYVFCEPCHCKGKGANDKETALANFHKELARKEKLALRKPEKSSPTSVTTLCQSEMELQSKGLIQL